MKTFLSCQGEILVVLKIVKNYSDKYSLHEIFRIAARNRGGGGDPSSFSCSADHERDWPPCKVVSSLLRVGNQCAGCEKQQTVDPKLQPSGNPFKYHVVALSLQPT